MRGERWQPAHTFAVQQSVLGMSCTLVPNFMNQPALLGAAQLTYIHWWHRGANISEDDFHKVADHTLEELADNFDALLESTDIEGSDLEYGVRCQHLRSQTFCFTCLNI